MVCGMAACIIAERRLPSKRQTALLLGLIAGITVILCMPAFHTMTGNRESNLLKSVWIESLINIVAFDCMFYAYLAAFIVCMMIRKTRRRLTADTRRFGFLIFALVFGAVLTVIYLKYYNGPRTGLFAQLVCMLGILRLFPDREHNAGRQHTVSAMTFSLVIVLCVVNLIAAIRVQTD